MADGGPLEGGATAAFGWWPSPVVAGPDRGRQGEPERPAGRGRSHLLVREPAGRRRWPGGGPGHPRNPSSRTSRLRGSASGAGCTSTAGPAPQSMAGCCSTSTRPTSSGTDRRDRGGPAADRGSGRRGGPGSGTRRPDGADGNDPDGPDGNGSDSPDGGWASRYADGRVTPSGEVARVGGGASPSAVGPSTGWWRCRFASRVAHRAAWCPWLTTGTSWPPRGPSPDGRWVAWVAWDHPSMPWDRSELWLGRLEEGSGTIRLHDRRRVAGGGEVSVGQPRWGRDGSLLFVDDRTGWWMPYRLPPRPWAGRRGRSPSPWSTWRPSSTLPTGSSASRPWPSGRTAPWSAGCTGPVVTRWSAFSPRRSASPAAGGIPLGRWT